MSLETHRAVEFAVGLGLVGVAIVLAVVDSGSEAIPSVLVAIALGAFVTFLGISERRETDPSRERTPMGPAAHRTADAFLAGALLLAGVLIALFGSAGIGIACVAAGAVEALLLIATRYETPPTA